ncbi:N-alpha-acetyltransferase 40 [Mangifera indica]|uniref:N-alpha-acetyltransferase 40 n=1 Tax=Mangifera indica TaxID=29780 RepID=UPI001CF95504|nr:N-alpha-acetyltransferase 40 [Mangifera indica]
MESTRLPSCSSSSVKKLKRRDILEKKKAIDQLIKAAYAQDDHLDSFAPFRHIQRNGVNVHLESGRGDRLSSYEKHYIQNLLKVNMEGPFGSEWPTEEKVKRREMVALEARYIFVREGDPPNASAGEDKAPIVGFVHYRFTLEEEVPVLYVYELQLESHLQRKGLGKFLMQLIELIARKNCMGAVVLTVQKTNLLAMNFYLSKLRYIISSISPSRVDPLTRVEKSYEILCKVFDQEYKSVLEESG